MLIWSKHICVFLVHVFHEAFYSQTLLKVVPGYRVLSAEISVCKSGLVTGKRPGPDRTRTC
jgi:hypothetical protein